FLNNSRYNASNVIFQTSLRPKACYGFGAFSVHLFLGRPKISFFEDVSALIVRSPLLKLFTINISNNQDCMRECQITIHINSNMECLPLGLVPLLLSFSIVPRLITSPYFILSFFNLSKVSKFTSIASLSALLHFNRTLVSIK
ncbi:hypothetical protein L9F63_010679, partial [Diploptera punctata]